MVRQSISIGHQNNEWIKSQIQSGEYGSKSEVINDLVRHAREKEHESSRYLKVEVDNDV